VSAALDAVAAARTVAAFDVDGTLTYRDTLMPFLVHVRGRMPVARAVAGAGPVLLRTAAGRESRRSAKEALLVRTLRGWWLDELRPLAEEYAQAVVERQLRPDRLQRLRWHQAQGHEVVLVSASPELYVGATATRRCWPWPTWPPGCTAATGSNPSPSTRSSAPGGRAAPAAPGRATTACRRPAVRPPRVRRRAAAPPACPPPPR
jgi:hypothetical protein